MQCDLRWYNWAKHTDGFVSRNLFKQRVYLAMLSVVIGSRSTLEDHNHNSKCHLLHEKMATSIIASRVHKADLEDASAKASVEELQPQGISNQTIIIIVSILGSATILAIVVGIISYFRHRRRRKANEERQQEIERSLQRARRPVLTLDTDIPIATQYRRSAGRVG